MEEQLTVYWAGPLFTQSERITNRIYAALLTERGYTVILPQDEAKPFIGPEGLDAVGIAEHCYLQSTGCDVLVANVDGADGDSGTCIEIGIRIGCMRALGRTPKVICVRTDFRGSEDGHLNVMFRLADKLIYVPSFDENPVHLINAIDEAIQQLT
jgi:nucleoside 2-deoxyribosyltransferase